jgi:hypothetical protein
MVHRSKTLRVAVAILTMLTLVAATTPDEQGHISGRVVDATTGEPVGLASVRVLQARRAMAADEDGRFLFRDLPAGTYTVAAERIGYAPATATVRVMAGETAAITVELRVSALTLPGVVVTGTGRARGAAETYQPTHVLAKQRCSGRWAPRWRPRCRDCPASASSTTVPRPASR